MIIIIIILLQPPLHSPPFLRNFANEDPSSMLGVVRKEKHLRYISNLTVNVHPRELRADATKSLPPASLTPRSPVPTCPSPQAQGSFEISPSDTLWGSIGGVMQVCERHRRSTLYGYYLAWRSSISPRHTDENSGFHQHGQLLRPSPKGRLFSRDVGWWNLQCCHALPAWMSLGTSQNTEL